MSSPIGINMPDHEAQFRSLEKQMKTHITPHIAFLKSQDCSNLKYLMENMINQFVNDGNDSFEEVRRRKYLINKIQTNFFQDLEEEKSHLKKSHLSLPLLQSWYEDLYPKKNGGNLLVVIIPDFESFNVKVLQSFILIVSSYLETLPFVFVFGIATSIATLHTSFPYHVSSF